MGPMTVSYPSVMFLSFPVYCTLYRVASNNTDNSELETEIECPSCQIHPVGIKFSPDGNALYIVSYGKTEIRTSIPASDAGMSKYKAGSGLYPFATTHAVVWPYMNTGVVWKVTKADGP
jgi:hypothetical protein